jgi:hypothetical protein
MKAVTRKLSAQLSEEQYWVTRLAPDNLRRSRTVVHLAILIEPYLQLILSGKKTVESRFSLNRIAPFGVAKAGDVLVLKRAGGPVLGICEVTKSHFYHLDPVVFSEIRRRFERRVCPMEADFWERRRVKRFASLLELGMVTSVTPVRLEKRDRRPWVILESYRQTAMHECAT